MLKPDVNSWIEWAPEGRIHPSVISFIHDQPKHLCHEGSAEEMYATESPRGWHGLSDILHQADDLGLDQDIVNAKAMGRVGQVAGLAYWTYYLYYRNVIPLAHAVVDSKGREVAKICEEVKGLPSRGERVVASMVVASNLMNRLNKILEKATKELGRKPANGKVPLGEDDTRVVERVAEFFSKMSPEDAIISIRSQIGVPAILQFGLQRNTLFNDLVIKDSNKRAGKN
jgi:hypothetical protein